MSRGEVQDLWERDISRLGIDRVNALLIGLIVKFCNLKEVKKPFLGESKKIIINLKANSNGTG